MENFVLYDEIGNANQQIIHKARRKGTIKYLAISCAEKHLKPLITNHVRLVNEFKHRNLIQFHEWYETSNHLWLVMELCTGGSLEQVIKEDHYLPEPVLRKFGADIVRGMLYVHSRGVIFNQCMPSRFLLDGNGTVKLFDFSLAHLEEENLDDVLSRYTDDEDFQQNLALEINRNIHYTAPETIKSQMTSKSSDFWSLGCLLYEMSCGYAPCSGMSGNECAERILNQSIPPPVIPGSGSRETLPPEFFSLLQSLLNKSPTKRMNADSITRHPFWHNILRDSKESTGITDEQNIENGLNLDESQLLDSLQENIPAEQEPTEQTIKERIQITTDDSNVKRPDSTNIEVQVFKEIDEPIEPETQIVNANGNPDLPELNEADSTVDDNLVVKSQSPSSEIPNDQPDDFVTKVKQQKHPNFTPNNRMVQSEYHSPNHNYEEEFSKTLFNLTRTTSMRVEDETELLKLIASEAQSSFQSSSKLRANLALIYPWGDESSHYPRENKLIANLWINFGSGHCTDADLDQIKHMNGDLNLNIPCGWRPRPLSDYARWSRVALSSKVEGLDCCYNQTQLRTASASEIKTHFDQVLQVYRTRFSDIVDNGSSNKNGVGKTTTNRIALRTSRINLLAYLLWLVSSTSNTVGKQRLPVAGTDNRIGLISLEMAPEILIETTKYLKASSNLSPDVRIGLCRLCSLISHRIALASTHQSSDIAEVNKFRTAALSSAPAFSSTLSTLVDIIREPLNRGGFRLRQAVLIALGEVLSCIACLLAVIIRQSEKQSLDIQPSQWQTVIHHLMRCLATTATNGTTTNTTNGTFGTESTSVLDNFDSALPRSMSIDYQGVLQNTDQNATSGNNLATQTTKIQEIHIRLSAARSLDAFVTSIIGCQLYDVSVSGSLLSSVNACIESVTTSEVISRLWTHGLMDPNYSRQSCASAQQNQLQQELMLSCANALAGIVRLNPTLFTSGIIDRSGSIAFTALVEPSSGGHACQQTDLVARLLSTAAGGLLPPLAIKPESPSSTKPRRSIYNNSKMTRSTSSATCNSGTAAACRRLLSDPKFTSAVFRHLESPHAMLRAKAFLLCSAILANSPQESLEPACRARLPYYLERNLKTTRGLQHHYTDAFDYSSNPSNTNISTSSGRIAESSSTIYLAACTIHLADLIVYDLIPTLCHQIAVSLGLTPFRKSNGAPPLSRQNSTNSTSARKLSRPLSMNLSVRNSPNNNNNNNSYSGIRTPSSTTTGTNASSVNGRSWLPAFNCLPILLSGCGPLRLRLFMPSNKKTNTKRGGKTSEQNDQPHFCLLSFIGLLLDHWASADPISSTGGSVNVHRSGSFENQLLSVVLTLIEDLSQQSNLVEARHQDLVRLVLPGLARLAVAPNSRPETRAICVKIITNLARIWLGDAGLSGSTTSLADLNRTNSMISVKQDDTVAVTHEQSYSERPLSADADLILSGAKQRGVGKKSGSISNLQRPDDSCMTRSYYSANRFDRTKTIRTRGKLKTEDKPSGLVPNNLGAAVQPPSDDLLITIFELVNKLMIPYAETLLSCSELTAPTAFLRLLYLLLVSVPPNFSNQFNATKSQTPIPSLACYSTNPNTIHTNHSHKNHINNNNNNNNPSNRNFTANGLNEFSSLDKNGHTHSNQSLHPISYLARELVTSISSCGLDMSMIRLFASQLLRISDHNKTLLTTGDLNKIQGSFISPLCLALFDLIPQLLRWPNECKASFLIMDLRLLEVVTFACLEFSQFIVPESTTGIEAGELRQINSNSPASRCTKKPPVMQSPKQRKLSQTNSNSPVRTVTVRTVSRDAYLPLLTGLNAMNALMNHVANVVRAALVARSTHSQNADIAAVAAEEILVSAQPHQSLAGMLARLIGLWKPRSIPWLNKTDGFNYPKNMSHQTCLLNTPEAIEEDEICFQLCEAAITSLTNYASLYGGEHSRSALTPLAADSLSLGLLRLSEEDQICQKERFMSNEPAGLARIKDNFGDSNTIRQVSQCRRRIRLLLRIIRRLVFSDPVCRAQLGSKTTHRFGNNLYRTLEYLLNLAQRSADASTCKLLREIFDLLSPAKRPNRERNALSGDRSQIRGLNITSNKPTSRVNTTAIA